MKCIKCQKNISQKDTYCRFCGKTNNKENKIKNKKTSKILIISLVIISLALIAETSFNIWYFYFRKDISSVENKINSFDYKPSYIFKQYNIGEPFIFDDLEITIGKDYSKEILENEYSLYNGKSVIKIPVEIKNIDHKYNSLNLFHYDIFDNNGNLIDEVAGYFEDALYYAEDLEENDTYIKYIYPLYFNNNNYILKFENKKETIFIIYKIDIS